jgi:hypothetical protein
MLVFCALFSTSTAIYICLSICLFIKSVWTGRINVRFIALLLLVLGFIGAIALFFPETFNGLFADKLSGSNMSGRTRIVVWQGFESLLGSFNLGNWLFGIGFGYAYLSIFMGLLANTGLIGLGLFVYLLFKPALVLPVRQESEGLKMDMIALIILCSLSLSELFIPTTWMFMALAHRRLALLKRERVVPARVRQVRLQTTVEARA